MVEENLRIELKDLLNLERLRVSFIWEFDKSLNLFSIGLIQEQVRALFLPVDIFINHLEGAMRAARSVEVQVFP